MLMLYALCSMHAACIQHTESPFLCPIDYPYLYMEPNKTNILIGNSHHWRRIDQTLCTFLTSSQMINKHFNQLVSMCEKEHYPFEKPLHEIYKKELIVEKARKFHHVPPNRLEKSPVTIHFNLKYQPLVMFFINPPSCTDHWFLIYPESLSPIEN